MRTTEATNDLATLQQWQGNVESMSDVVTLTNCQRLAHTLDRDQTFSVGDVLPPLWHVIFHVGSVADSALGRDGHPERGGFLPPVALPRRMWASSEFTFHDDIRIGDDITKTSTVEAVEMKEGRTGALCFITLRHELTNGTRLLVTEAQNLVYRDDPGPDAVAPTPKPAPLQSDFSETVTPSEVLLFRYSAITFNGHRIHYDRDYARDVEGYDGLVVHGPLTATLLADLAVRECDASLASFSFRGRAPLLDTAPFTISGTRDGNLVTLWAATPEGGIAMEATAELR